MPSEPPNQDEPNLAAIQKANPNLNLPEFLSALQNGSKEVILKIQETGESFEFKIIANDTGSWIKAHPIQASLISISAVTCIVPAVATAPLFMALGLGANGPIAGGAAALFQSWFGQVAARGAFATLQSAAMGGYGVAAVNGVISAASATGAIVTGLWSWKKKADEVVVEAGGVEDDSNEEEEKNFEKRNGDTLGEGTFKFGDEDSHDKAKL